MSTRPTTHGTARRVRRPVAVSALVAALVGLSLVALVGGTALAVGPDGRYVGVAVDLDPATLAGTPVSDFAVPGVALVALGLYPLLPLAGLAVRAAWSWQASVFAGLLTTGWVATAVAVGTPVGPALPAVAALALATAAVAVLPSVRTHCAR